MPGKFEQRKAGKKMKTDIQIVAENGVDELLELLRVFREVFEMDKFESPGKSYLEKLVRDKRCWAVVAKVNGKVIGGLTMYILPQYYSAKPLAYIYDLAVLTAYQRQGVGRQLIDFVKTYCREFGIDEFFVQAEKVDDHAVDFYRKTGPTEELEAVHFSYTLNKRNDSETNN